ncbi:GDSL-like Lipase/Acylhydrolase [Caulobacter sp. AP07]|uniref:SGNH/GDSL hydrolase family protein n=1 Tax=Caulobacter sp. AP07 TaxID=1144304 RepID=UPI000271DF2D|nr:SGNH/GDSL hydrolase family protein [Caulobacter sp. AP07]EJL26480.1 GDSL-like Lipase/Acylhydrolase [Caulobacter sp. AP07]
MRSLILAAVAVLALSHPASAAQTALTSNIGGRAVALPGGAAAFGWPGVYFEGRFTGPSVEVAVDAGAEHLAVSVDGQVRAELSTGSARLTLGGLGPGEHVVRLDKLTESQAGSARFLGFFVGPGGRALPPRARARRIEFIGDSHTVGYGVRATKHDCTEAEIHDLTDTSLTFGPILSRRLDADYRIVAFSGRGVVRNYGGSSPGQPLPALYPRMIPGEAAPSVDPAEPWRPDLIVIGLGTNDFSTPLQPGEAWADEAALHADYRQTYAGFIRDLARRQPQARFLLIAGDSFAADVDQVVQAVDAETPGLATPVRITGMDLGACNWHPSAADQRMMADKLEAAARVVLP